MAWQDVATVVGGMPPSSAAVFLLGWLVVVHVEDGIGMLEINELSPERDGDELVENNLRFWKMIYTSLV